MWAKSWTNSTVLTNNRFTGFAIEGNRTKRAGSNAFLATGTFVSQ
jgi:hypothetical protein